MDDLRSRHIVIGMFRDRTAANRAYDSLTPFGFTRNDLSLLMSNESHAQHFGEGDPAATQLTGNDEAPAGLGAGFADLAQRYGGQPGVRIFAMGALAGAVAVVCPSGSFGFVSNALIESGVPPERANLFQHGLNEGAIVFGVTLKRREDAEHVQRAWRNARGENIYLMGPEGDPTTDPPIR